MSKRYPGGYIFRSNPTIVGPTGSPPEGGSAPGVWTLEQASYYTKLGIWPLKIYNRTLYSWGRNDSGQLGLNDTVYRSSPTQVGSLTNWYKISGGKLFNTSIKTDGTLWAWGSNSVGQIGVNTSVAQYNSPVQVGALTTWMSVAAGGYQTLAIKSDNTLWAWGDNQDGQLGQNDRVNRSSPIQVGALSNWLTVSSTYSSTIAIKTDGTLWSWGRNSLGQLGQNIATTTNRSSPVQVGALTNWSKIACGAYHVLAVKTDGTLWSWGYNSDGQLGQSIATTVNRSSPVQVGALTNWESISTAATNSYSIKTDGTMWGWGNNIVGSVGDTTVVSRSSPVQIGSLTTWSSLVSSSSSGNAALAIKTDGTLWTWGSNNRGQLGINSTANRSSPTQVGALTTWGIGAQNTESFIATNLPELEASKLWGAGYDANGALGQNDRNSVNSPVLISSQKAWTSVAVSQSGAGIKNDGTLFTWGRNNYGQLGLNDVVDRSFPTQVGADANWSQVSCGGYFAAAIKTNGTLWAWGINSSGELGQNDRVYRSSPVQVGALTNWLSISAGDNIGAIKTNGTLWMWGGGGFGQIGDNAVISRSSPVQIGSDTNWAQLSIGNRIVLAIRTNGTLWSWGANANGELGLNDLNRRSSPTQIGALTNWSKVAGGGWGGVAVKTDGTLWTWGQNGYGELGLDISAGLSTSSPIQVGALTTWSKVAAAAQAGYAIKTDSTLWSWGRNNSGQLGDGTYTNRSSPVQVGSLTNWNSVVSGGDSNFFYALTT